MFSCQYFEIFKKFFFLFWKPLVAASMLVYSKGIFKEIFMEIFP